MAVGTESCRCRGRAARCGTRSCAASLPGVIDTDPDRGTSFPPVVRIDPMSPPGTIKVDYVVVAEHDFGNRHRRAIERAVAARLEGRVAMRTEAADKRLAVRVEPADSLAGFGSFAVLDVLRTLLRPAVPHSALGALLSSALTPGAVRVGLMVLGRPDDATLDALGASIGALPLVHRVERSEDPVQQLVLTVAGPWRETLPTLREELIPAAGVASTILVNSQR